MATAALGPGLFLMAMLSALGGGGDLDLAAFVGPELYWQHVEDRTPDTEALITMAAPPAVDDEGEVPDISGLIDQLADPSYDKRQAAAEKIVEHGAAVAPQLKAAKDHDDPEVRVHVERLLTEVTKSGEAWPLRRLMAIRTLGRQKAREAAPMLRRLRSSDDPFIADAARQALAEIEGKAYAPRRVTAAQLESDLALLPSDSRIVAQIRGKGGGPPQTLANVLDPKLMAGFGVDADDIERHRDRAAGEMIKLLERIGNVRVDAITVGLTGNPDKGGIAVVVARGLCDPEAVGAMLADQRLGKQELDGHTYYEQTDLYLWLASAERMVMVAAERDEPRRAALRRLFAAAGGDAEQPKLNAKVAGLIKTLDREANPAWMVASLDGQVFPPNPVTGAFQSAVLTGEPTEKGGVKLNLRAEGDDAEKAAAAVAVIKGGHQMLLARMKQMVERVPAMEDLRETVEGLRIDQAEGTGKVAMSIEIEDGGKAMMLMPMMLFSGSAGPPPAPAVEQEAAEAEDQAVEAEAAPAGPARRE